jgi:phosphatidyl-myo-inositol dimannoside synthase
VTDDAPAVCSDYLCKMTALLLAYDFPPMGGGIARLHGELARRFPSGELFVSTLRDPGAAAVDREFDGAVNRLPINRRYAKTVLGLLLWSRRAVALARERRVRFVYCGNLKPAGYPARWVFERTRTPYCVFLYGGELLSEQQKYRGSKFKRRAGRMLLGGAAALVAISGWTRGLALAVLEELGLDGHADRVRVVPLGTDPVHFRPGIDTHGLPERFALPNRSRWLLTVARLDPHKGVDTVLRALPAIVARAPDVQYAVVGSGPERAWLEQLARRTGVADRVHFLGHVADSALPSLYNMASVYVGASRRAEPINVEGFGISFVEASACALPIVAGDSGGVADAVRDGETGLLVSPEDPAAVARAVSQLLGDPGLAQRLGAAGRRAVETYYNWDRVIRDLRAIEADCCRAVDTRGSRDR